MKLWLLLICVVVALNPVTDFRVLDMDKALVNSKKISGRTLETYPGKGLLHTKAGSSNATVNLDSLIIPLKTDKYKSIYWVDVSVNQVAATNNQTFPLLLDTGSAIAWIANSSCLSDGCSRAPKFFYSTVTPTEFSLDYSSGKISGLLVDAPKSNITYTINHSLVVNNFTCGLAGSVPSFFSNYNISGILGLSANASLERGTNLLSQLRLEKAVDSAKFAIILGSPDNVNSSFGGLLALGQMADKYATSLAQLPIQSRPVVPNISGYWMVKVTLVSAVSSTGTNSTFNGAVAAVFDTGTTGLALPLADATAMHQMLFGNLFVADNQGNYAFPCNATGSIKFNLDGLILDLSVDLIRADEYTTAGLQGMCSSKMQGLGSTPNWVLGASFLKNYYTVFDVDHQSIGFSPRVSLYSYIANENANSSSISGGGSSSKTSSAVVSSSSSSSQKSSTSTRAAGSASFNSILSPWTLLLFLISII
ncbi:hypothetical protein PUMCH_003759 [Australozyma saopauloensis]|uniref:Peptidase A1 domain-containing protein n=1 Tax=Australozyma saopauloensis TaxID=291208 RepID=A0AAX4HDB3_9ASCO|nr:hypothetical protein PUMCH_003759 [[Candida] saopauloensis]